MRSKAFGGFRKLSWRMSTVFVLCMLIPMLISMFTSGFFSDKYLEDSASNGLFNVALEKKNQIELAMTDLSKQAKSISMQSIIVDSLSEAAAKSTNPSEADLKKISKTLEDNFNLGDGLFENMFLMYNNVDIADGIGGVSVGWENEEVGSADNLLIRDATMSPTTGRPVITIVTPVKKNDKHLGTIGMAIELNNMVKDIIDSNSLEDGYKTLILNSSGLVISATDPEYVFTLDFQDEESGLQNFYNTLISEESGVGFFTLDGTDYIAAYNNTSKYGMYILSYIPVSAYRKMTGSLKNILSLVILISIIVISVIIYVFSGKITKPILITAEQAKLLANGDLSVKIHERLLKRNDELGMLSNSFATMILKLKTVITQITDISDQVAASSEELYASGEEVGKAAEDVGNTILEIATGAEEQSNQINLAQTNLSNLVNQINEVNASTENMEKTTALMIDDIGRGSRSVTESIDRINDLKTETEEASRVIFELGNTSNQIGEIVELIRGIAGQTNLLALNAAIEAARAGDAGRGFSVVAEEIRNLAEESANASGRIADLIVEIRNGVDIAVNKMDNSVKSVNYNVESIEENRDIFSEIKGQAERLNDIVSDVTQSVKIMTESSLEFERTMKGINKASQEFAANAEGVSAASEEQIALTSEIVSSAKALAVMSEELSSHTRIFTI